MPTPAPTTGISKREQKRQAKANGIESIDPINGTVLPVLEEPVSTDSTPAEVKKTPYIEPVQKRIRYFLKKKRVIDQLNERAARPEEYEKLNKDQLDTLARSAQVLAPLKELQNLAEQFTEIETEHTKSLQTETRDAARAKAEAVEAGKQEGLNDGKKIVASLIAFLGYASILRLNPTSDEEFNDANERLLNIVYLGGEESMSAATCLEAASEDKIDGTEITYKRIHDAIFQQSQESQEIGVVEDAPEEDKIENETSPSTNGALKGSNFISLSDIANNPSSIGSGGISFLNESEIEGSHHPESAGIPADAAVPAPSQTLVDVEAAHASDTGLDWSKSTTGANWADEESSDSPADSDPIAVPEDQVVSQIQQPNLQPVDEFKTVEKKAPAREGRGRGRGHGRGRGDRGGRGRGEHRGESRGGRSRGQ